MQTPALRQGRSTEWTRQRIPDAARWNRGIDGDQELLILENDLHEGRGLTQAIEPDATRNRGTREERAAGIVLRKSRGVHTSLFVAEHHD